MIQNNRDYEQAKIDETAFKEEVKASVIPTVNQSVNFIPNKNVKYYPEKYIGNEESMDLYKIYGGEKVDHFEFEVFKHAMTYYLTVKQRFAQKEEGIPEMLDLLKAHLNKSIRACKWLISQFSNTEVLFENIVQCPISDMRRLSCGLIYCAMINLYNEEKDTLNDYWKYKEGLKDSLESSLLRNFINILLCSMEETRNFTEYNTQYFQLIARFAGLGQEARLYLLKANILTRFHIFSSADNEGIDKTLLETLDLTFEQNENVEIGLPTNIDKVHISFWEEMIMKKRDASIADAQQDSTFIWETMSLCLRSCQLGPSDLPTFVDDLRYTEFSEYDIHLLSQDEKEISALIENCNRNLAIRHM